MKIVSGGQTGVDRGAIDAALDAGVPAGGWCPAGRRAEDGAIDPVYPLTETPTADYRVRTEWNVRDSDGTLILNSGALEGGTLLTAQLARRLGRPVLHVDLGAPARSILAQTVNWLAFNDIKILNVAGPRESKRPGIQARARVFVTDLLNHLVSRAESGDGQATPVRFGYSDGN